MHVSGLEPPAPDPDRLPVEDLGVYEDHGGHTLRSHVDTRPGDEFKRILREGVAAAGRFVNRATAQHCLQHAVWSHSKDIRAWLSGPEAEAPYTCVQDMGRPIGRCLTWDDLSRGVTIAKPVTAVRIVLRRDGELPGGYTVVTAYPTRAPRRGLS
ncbi:MAG TPA: RNase A-like domain-containing protein [Candidatus Dormibacteraeota bacterium]